MRKSWHVAHKFCTFSGSYLMRSTRTLVTVKRELHGPDSCWNSFLSQQGKSTSAITRWFISSGHWHLCDESPIQTSLHPPIICRPFNQHNQLKPTMSLLPSYSWMTWIHPKNPHWTSKGSLNWFIYFFFLNMNGLTCQPSWALLIILSLTISFTDAMICDEAQKNWRGPLGSGTQYWIKSIN